MKVVFFGTPHFAAHILRYLLVNRVNVVAVVTKPDRPKGRSGSPVPAPAKVVALEHHLPVYQPEIASSPDFADTLKQHEADLFLVVAYGEIIKQHLLDMPRLGCINVHPSLLPKYRGANPIQRAILNGETETGVCVMYLVKKMDAGDVIKSAKVPIGPNTTYGELEQDLVKVGEKLLLEVLHDLEKGVIQRTPQDHALATHAAKIELEDCEIHWDQPAQIIHNLVRGANPEPAAWCMVRVRGELKRLKIFRTRLIEGTTGNPGEILHSGKDGIAIACGSGAVLISELQLEGKKVMSAADLIRGLPATEIAFKEPK